MNMEDEHEREHGEQTSFSSLLEATYFQVALVGSRTLLLRSHSWVTLKATGNAKIYFVIFKSSVAFQLGRAGKPSKRVPLICCGT